MIFVAFVLSNRIILESIRDWCFLNSGIVCMMCSHSVLLIYLVFCLHSDNETWKMWTVSIDWPQRVSFKWRRVNGISRLVCHTIASLLLLFDRVYTSVNRLGDCCFCPRYVSISVTRDKPSNEKSEWNERKRKKWNTFIPQKKSNENQTIRAGAWFDVINIKKNVDAARTHSPAQSFIR